MAPFHCLPEPLGFCRVAAGLSSSTTCDAPTEEAMEWTVASCDGMLGGAVVDPPLGPPLLPFWPLGLNTVSSFDAMFGPT